MVILKLFRVQDYTKFSKNHIPTLSPQPSNTSISHQGDSKHI